MSGTLAPDLFPSRDRSYGKKKVRKPIPSKILVLKGAISELRDNYFLALEDNPKYRQDNFQSTWKVIGRYVSRKVEYPQNFAPLFDKFEASRIYLSEEPRPNQQGIILRTDEAIWEL